MATEDHTRECERVEWDLPVELLQRLREFCANYNIPESEAVRKSIERFIAERLLEEGE